MNTLTAIHKNTLIDEVKNSKTLAGDQKSYYVSLLERAAEATNGVSQEEKLQACSELNFAILCLILGEKTRESRTGSLYSLIEKCKTEICICVGIIAAMLVFQPQLGTLLEKLFK